MVSNTLNHKVDYLIKSISMIEETNRTVKRQKLRIEEPLADDLSDEEQPTDEEPIHSNQPSILRDCQRTILQIQSNSQLKIVQLQLKVDYLQKALDDAEAMINRLKMDTCLHPKEEELQHDEEMKQRHLSSERHLNALLFSRNKVSEENLKLKRVMCNDCRQRFRLSMQPTPPVPSPTRPTWQSTAQQLVKNIQTDEPINHKYVEGPITRRAPPPSHAVPKRSILKKLSSSSLIEDTDSSQPVQQLPRITSVQSDIHLSLGKQSSSPGIVRQNSFSPSTTQQTPLVNPVMYNASFTSVRINKQDSLSKLIKTETKHNRGQAVTSSTRSIDAGTRDMGPNNDPEPQHPSRSKNRSRKDSIGGGGATKGMGTDDEACEKSNKWRHRFFGKTSPVRAIEKKGKGSLAL